MKMRDTILHSLPVTLDDSFDEAGKGDPTSQTSTIQTNCSYSVCKNISQFGGKNGVLIQICPTAAAAQASSVAASDTGKMMLDTTWSKYWFVPAVKVSMTIDAASKKAGVVIGYDSPATTLDAHSLNSSISANIGVFGGVPTAGATTNSSYSTQIDDFKVNNHSKFADGTLDHDYLMAATKDGAFDLNGGGTNWWSVALGGWGFLAHHNSYGGMFSGIMGTPNDPPDAAISNFPLASQGLWVAPIGFNAVTTFTVKIDVLYWAAHTNAGGSSVNDFRASQSFQIPIDWSAV